MSDARHCRDCGRSDSGCGFTECFSSKGEFKYALCEPCARKERWADYERTGTLTTRVMVDACIDAVRGHPSEAKNATDRIQEATRRFEQTVWFGGLREHIASHAERGESLEHDGLKLMTYVLAGRVMFTLEDDAASVTLITTEENDDTPRMGIQGISAREHQALDLIARAELAWKLGVRTQPDKKVSVL